MMTAYQQAPNVLATELAAGDVVMMDVDLAKYFGLAQTAAAIWSLLAEPATIDELVDSLTQRYEIDAAPCRADTEAFIGQLLERNLIVATG